MNVGLRLFILMNKIIQQSINMSGPALNATFTCCDRDIDNNVKFIIKINLQIKIFFSMDFQILFITYMNFQTQFIMLEINFHILLKIRDIILCLNNTFF
jgi:hypothetical protein